jgi:hypothetical protein
MVYVSWGTQIPGSIHQLTLRRDQCRWSHLHLHQALSLAHHSSAHLKARCARFKRGMLLVEREGDPDVFEVLLSMIMVIVEGLVSHPAE